MENKFSLNIEELIMELLSNAIFFKSNAIAIRFNGSKQKLQVIDNGIGISKRTLKKIGENEGKVTQSHAFPKSFIFEKIYRNAQNLLITSRTTNSPITFVKVFKKGFDSKIIEGEPRPSNGTTVSIYGLNLPLTKTNKYLVCKVVATFALFHHQVSFSVRDEDADDILIRISKPHGSHDILNYIYKEKLANETNWYLEVSCPNSILKAYVGFTKNASKYTNHVFVNFKLAICEDIENLLCKVLQKVYHYWFNDELDYNLFYILFIECSITDINYCSTVDKLVVQFKNHTLIENLKLELKKIIVHPILKKIRYKKQQRDKYETTESKIMLNQNDLKIRRKRKYSCITIQNSNCMPSLKKSAVIYQPAQEQLYFAEEKNVTLENESSLMCKESIQENVDLAERTISTLIVQESNGNGNMTSNGCDILETTEMSQWSDWNYEIPQNVNKFISKNIAYFYPQREVDELNNNQYYTFLPVNLQNHLKYKNKKIIQQFTELCQTEDQQEIKIINFTNKQFRRFETRNVEKTRHADEFKLNKKCLHNIKVLKQVNHEFIAALSVQNNKLLLLLVDQHAVDERIRYEQLLEVYTVNGKKDEYVSDVLKTPISISDVEAKICSLLSKNQYLLQKYGVTLKIDANNITVFSVPLCFRGRKHWNDDCRLISYTRKLLIEIAESMENTSNPMILPSSIHLAIATEACHGAIKFGFPLNVQQCESLLQALSYTQGFSRCAHGRPSIIPLLDLTNLIHAPKSKIKKLNFASITKKRRSESYR